MKAQKIPSPVGGLGDLCFIVEELRTNKASARQTGPSLERAPFFTID
jgi:hypothetical protein